MAIQLAASIIDQPLAIAGGPKAVPQLDASLFHWPIVTQEDEQAVLEVLRAGTMSNTDVTKKFEAEVAQWQGTKFALAYPNGTMALLAAMYGLGVRRGDEIIVPSMTYWASATPVYALGGTPVFADIDQMTLCVDPTDIERHISDRTRLIIPVHYAGHPAAMDSIMTIADKHGIKVLEDISHAQGALYKGRKVGTFGHAAVMSMMAAKSFAIGEGGMLITNDRQVYETAAAFGNYARHDEILTDDFLRRGAGIPLGGVKGRLNQTAAAMGRVQLKYYDQRITEIQNAMNRFWDYLEGVPGIRAHRTTKNSDSTMGGWYLPQGHYINQELNHLSIEKFCAAVRAEGFETFPGANRPLHLHPVFNDIDIYGDGKPTRIAFSGRDLRQARESLPNAVASMARTFGVPWFKHDRPEQIERYAAAFRKVAHQADTLQ